MATTPFTYENPACQGQCFPMAPLSEEELTKMKALLNPQIQADASGNVTISAEKAQQLYELLSSLNNTAYKLDRFHTFLVVYADPDRAEEVMLSQKLVSKIHNVVQAFKSTFPFEHDPFKPVQPRSVHIEPTPLPPPSHSHKGVICTEIECSTCIICDGPTKRKQEIICSTECSNEFYA